MLQYLKQYVAGRAAGRCLTEAELASYVDDLAGPAEVRRVERHARGCTACAEALSEAHLLLLGLPAEGSFAPPAALVHGVLESAARIGAGTHPTRIWDCKWAPARRLAGTLAAVALAIVLPAVACLAGYEYFMRGPMAQPPSASGQALCAQHAVSRGSPPSQGPAPAIAQPNQQAEGASGVSGVSAVIDRTLSTASQQALAESGLPQTAEQRATWARKEFPHVMDLYDLITADTSPVGVLATSIEPACVLVVPGPRAADMQASMQCTLAAPAAAPWDGTPACAPEWAEAMPGRSGWPCGWQALVVFSGEIFKLDCPESLAENKVKPTVEGVLAAARIAGWVVRDGAGSDRYAQPQPPAVTPEYVNRLASNLELVQSVVAYVAVSSELVETPEFMEVAGLARSLLRETYSSTSPCKRSAQTRQVLLNELFSRRRDALEALAGRISPGEVR